MGDANSRIRECRALLFARSEIPNAWQELSRANGKNKCIDVLTMEDALRHAGAL